MLLTACADVTDPIVENGRITFLNGYGETLAGSGEKVTPDTVFRWASVSKGVAATMIGVRRAKRGRESFSLPGLEENDSRPLRTATGRDPDLS